MSDDKWAEVNRIYRQMHPEHDAEIAKARAEWRAEIDERLLTADPTDVVPPRNSFPSEQAWRSCVDMVRRSQVAYRARGAGLTGELLESVQYIHCKIIRVHIRIYQSTEPTR